MGRSKKFIGMLAVTVLAALVPMLDDNAIDGAEWINVILLLAGAVTVYGQANMPAGVWVYAKTIAACVSAVAVIAVSAITDGMITGGELIQMALALGGALGVTPLLNNTGSAPNGASTVQTGMPADFALAA